MFNQSCSVVMAPTHGRDLNFKTTGDKVSGLAGLVSKVVGPANEQVIDLDMEEMMGRGSFVQALPAEDVVAEIVPGPAADVAEEGKRGARELEASVLAPCALEVVVPEGYVPGSYLSLLGPKGKIVARPPAGSQAGDKVTIKLAPRPEFRIEVPPRAAEGATLRFLRKDGTEVCVQVPKGARPGDSFDVVPPVLMVQIPEGARPGDLLVFQADAHGRCEAPVWCRAPVPAGRIPLEYLPVRMPPPSSENENAGL